MNEIDHITNEVLPATNALAPAAANRAQSRAEQLADLQAEAEFLQVAYGLAEKACGGQLVADHFRGKPADGAIAIAYGASLGWHWTKSLQDVYVIKGKPAIQSKEMRELIIRAGHQIWEEEVGPTKVVLAGRRADSDVVVRVEWTIEKAQKAGLTSNKLYDTMPENMLYARCTTDLAKRMAPDALSGLGIVEELRDQDRVRVTSEQVRPPRRGVAGLKAALAPAPTPEQSVIEYATPDQQQRISELLDAAGTTTKPAKLKYLQEQFGDGIKSAADITGEQAGQLIAFLEQPEDGGAA
ncbi:MAG: hypothetical protein WAX14_18585 [Rhodococcus sp. (in: high G+C Gram-positive bacteria)]|uniref:hypothetical protein n=1 Tax=Rhodococcus sp. TaxID=1831 RepID=UPI003BB7B627